MPSCFVDATMTFSEACGVILQRCDIPAAREFATIGSWQASDVASVKMTVPYLLNSISSWHGKDAEVVKGALKRIEGELE